MQNKHQPQTPITFQAESATADVNERTNHPPHLIVEKGLRLDVQLVEAQPRVGLRLQLKAGQRWRTLVQLQQIQRLHSVLLAVVAIHAGEVGKVVSADEELRALPDQVYV